LLYYFNDKLNPIASTLGQLKEDTREIEREVSSQSDLKYIGFLFLLWHRFIANFVVNPEREIHLRACWKTFGASSEISNCSLFFGEEA
jgi:hypothetical protein